MRKTLPVRAFLALAVTVTATVALAAPPSGASLPEATDLWGGPAARGTGAFGAAFDTVIHVETREATVGSVEFWSSGRLVDSQSFTTGAGPRWASFPTPAVLDGKGAFLWRVRADRPVSAWALTTNKASSGEFGASFSAFAGTDFLVPGDEASGAPMQAATTDEAGSSRTNVGLLCSPLSFDTCSVDVSAFLAGQLVGTGTVSTGSGSANQQALSALIPATAGRNSFGVRFRVVSGLAMPYAVRNDNRTSDPVSLPLAVTRGAFSTAPRIDFFSASPVTGCAPLSTTFVWSTTGAVRAVLSGLGSSLPPSGSFQGTLPVTTDVVLTAFSPSGASTSQPVHVEVLQATPAPTPSPATATVPTKGSVVGVVPSGIGPVTAEFTTQESTGSTFILNGNAFTYTAGTTPGTDVVTLTAGGVCGPATATFTATVVAPGNPAFVSLTADPDRACSIAPYNIVVSWQTTGAEYVIAPGQPLALPPNGFLLYEFAAGDSFAKAFTLTAWNADRQKSASKTVTVPVDTQLVTPVALPTFALLHPGESQTFMVTLQPAGAPFDFLGAWVLENRSGGGVEFWDRMSGTFRWRAGLTPGGIDVIRFPYHNGCGTAYAEVRIQVLE